MKYILNDKYLIPSIRIDKDYKLRFEKTEKEILTSRKRIRNECRRSQMKILYQNDKYLDSKDVCMLLSNVMHVGFEVTDSCNLRCVYCIYGNLYDNYDLRINKKIEWDNAVYYSNLAFLGYGIRERHHKRVLEDTILVPFEDEHFCVMKGYDEALREKYGDYMKLPPKEKQVRGHDINKYYWK